MKQAGEERKEGQAGAAERHSAAPAFMAVSVIREKGERRGTGKKKEGERRALQLKKIMV